MENHIYRVTFLEGYDLEFSIVGTNEVDPYVEIKELGICVFNEEMQMDAGLGEAELDSLIHYLEDARRYINSFNRESRSKTKTE